MMFYSGKSLKQSAESLAEVYGAREPSKATVWRWVRKYTSEALDLRGNHKAHTVDTWIADAVELMVHGQKHWHWTVIDGQTHYILAARLSRRGDVGDAIAVMCKATTAAANTPKEVRTDKFESFAGAIDNVWNCEVGHVQAEDLRGRRVSNSRSACQANSDRSVTYMLRRLDDLTICQPYIDGWVLTHNLFSERASLDNMTPARVAGVEPSPDS